MTRLGGDRSDKGCKTRMANTAAVKFQSPAAQVAK